MQTAVEPVHFVDQPPGHPTASQLAAKDQAERRASELRPGLLMPTWKWVHAPDVRTLALARFPAFGPVVWIRDDLPPAQVYRTALHELQHVYDAELIVRDLISPDEAEDRAEDFAGYALGGEPTMSFFNDQCRLVDALCSQGRTRTAAWARVRNMSPSEVPVHVAAGGGPRNGHAAAPGPGLTPLPRCRCGGLMLQFFPGATYRVCHRCGRGN